MQVTYEAPVQEMQAAPGANAAKPRLAAAAHEFESVLLGQWLQDAESSFAAVPGSDDDAEAGGEQMRSFGTQQLAASFTNSGGIGIAKLVQGALAKSQDEHATNAHATAVGAASTAGSAFAAMQVYAAEKRP